MMFVYSPEPRVYTSLDESIRFYTSLYESIYIYVYITLHTPTQQHVGLHLLEVHK